MADPIKAPAKPVEVLKRCGERVKLARVMGEGLSVEVLGTQPLLKVGATTGGVTIEAMALHPGGLYIQRGGRRILVPYSAVAYAEIADGET